MSVVTTVRSELKKQFTVSTWWIFLVIITVLSALFAVLPLTATFIPISSDMLWFYIGVKNFIHATFAVLGVVIATSDFRNRLSVPTMLAAPRRGQVIVAKLIAGCILGALISALAVAVYAGGSYAASPTLDVSPLGFMFLAHVLWVALGVAVGLVIRNRIVAILIALVLAAPIALIVQQFGADTGLLAAPLRFTPDSLTEAFVFGGEPSQPVAALCLTGYILVLSVIGWLTTWRRDIH